MLVVSILSFYLFLTSFLSSTFYLFDGVYFFFFKQKTAYELRISDWSSDVCSSDLHEFELFLMGKDAHDRANKLAECLPEAEFVVAGHIVVDATVDRLSCSQGDAGEPLAFMTVSLLTVEDW